MTMAVTANELIWTLAGVSQPSNLVYGTQTLGKNPCLQWSSRTPPRSRLLPDSSDSNAVSNTKLDSIVATLFANEWVSFLR